MNQIKGEVDFKKGMVIINSDSIHEETGEQSYFLKVIRPDNEESRRFYIPNPKFKQFLRVQEKANNFVPDKVLIEEPEDGFWESLELTLPRAKKLVEAINSFNEPIKFCLKRFPTEAEAVWLAEQKKIRAERYIEMQKIDNFNRAIETDVEKKRREMHALDCTPPPGYVLAKAPYFSSAFEVGSRQSFRLFWNKRIKLLRNGGDFKVISRRSYREMGKYDYLYFIKEELVVAIVEDYKKYARQKQDAKLPKKNFCSACGKPTERPLVKRRKIPGMSTRCDACQGRRLDKNSKHCVCCGNLFFKSKSGAIGSIWGSIRKCQVCRQK